MTLEDRVAIEASLERIFDFFEHMDQNYLAWHPDHIAFRWTKGRGLEPGVEFYFEETIAGKRLKKTVRFTRVERYRYIEFEPTWWLMRLFVPRFSFEVVPQDGACTFVAKISIRTGPIGAWLNRRDFEAVRQHMREEGQSLKMLLEQKESVSG